MQGVIKVITTTATVFGNKIRSLLAWPVGSRIACNTLNYGVRLHTWVGMIGYCHKDVGLPHFVNVHSDDVTDDMIAEGRRQYVMLGSSRIKKKCSITAENLFERVDMFWRHCLGASRGYGIVTVLREMIRSGQFFPSARWICPAQGRGMSRSRAQIMFRMVHSYEDTTLADINYIFFDHVEELQREGRAYSLLGINAIANEGERDDITHEAEEREANETHEVHVENNTAVDGVHGAHIDTTPTPVPSQVHATTSCHGDASRSRARTPEAPHSQARTPDANVSRDAGAPITPSRRPPVSIINSSMYQDVERLDNVMRIINEGRNARVTTRNQRRRLTASDAADYIPVPT